MKIKIPSSRTQIFGIIGNPLTHTLSPLLHNNLYESMDVDAIYIPFQIKDPTKEELLTMNKYGLRGLSVTIPYKEWAFSIADSATDSAKIMGAGNTLLLNDGGIHLSNTDGLGAKRSIENYDPSLIDSQSQGDILILGSGGSARGIGFAILEDWKKSGQSPKKNIVISARNHEKGLQLVGEMNLYLPGSTLFIGLEDMRCSSPSYVKLVIHTTQVGMSGQETGTILPSESLHEDMVVFDIVYNPLKTEFVKLAEKKGIPTIPGLDMLLYQGLEQFRIFTGINPDKNAIKESRKLLISELKKRTKT